MKQNAIVEVATDLDSSLRSRLVAAAYRYSRTGAVTLALKGVSRKTVDGILDPVVRVVGLRVWGTRYVEAADLGSVLEEAEPGTVVVGSSPEFCEECLRRGIAPLSVEEALRQWDSEGQVVSVPAQAIPA